MKYAFTPLKFGDTPEEFRKIKALLPQKFLIFLLYP